MRPFSAEIECLLCAQVRGLGHAQRPFTVPSHRSETWATRGLHVMNNRHLYL